ncbi:hypothetical protein LCGC14_1057860 [marine sediment metagenome]|uniref:Uncharacterized protein n=1 Tax=marine sediment metagenome TaxID=412755 RepID=A0A0F9QT15_9ZZZZ
MIDKNDIKALFVILVIAGAGAIAVLFFYEVAFAVVIRASVTVLRWMGVL